MKRRKFLKFLGLGAASVATGVTVAKELNKGVSYKMPQRKIITATEVQEGMDAYKNSFAQQYREEVMKGLENHQNKVLDELVKAHHHTLAYGKGGVYVDSKTGEVTAIKPKDETNV